MNMQGMVRVAAAAAAVAAIGCGGDQGGSAASRSAAANTGAGRSRPRATLTGCLENGDQPGSYVLRLAAAADTATTGTATGDPSPAGAWAQGRAFRVMPPAGQDLSQELNTRVAINGYIESGSSASAAGSTDRAIGGAGTTAA